MGRAVGGVGTTRLHRFVLMGIALFVISMVGQFRVPLLADIGRDVALTTVDLGLLTTLFAAGRLATDLPAGVLVDRLGVRRILVMVGFLSALGSWLFASAHDRWLVLVAALILGVASAHSNLAGMTYFSTNADDHRRGRAMAAYGVAIRGGGAIGPIAAGSLAALGGWRSAMWVGGAVSAALAVAVLMPGMAWSRSRVAAGDRRDATATSRVGHDNRAVAEYSSTQRLVLDLVPFTGLFAQGALPQTLIPVIGVNSLGLSTASVGVALGIGGVMRIVGTVAGGWVADHVGRKVALVPGLALQTLAIALLALEGRLWAWVTSIVLMSVAAVGTSVSATMLGDQAPPADVGRQLGRFRLMGDAGLLAGPLLMAPLFDTAGQQATAMVVVLLVLACTLAVAIHLPETGEPSHHIDRHTEPFD